MLLSAFCCLSFNYESSESEHDIDFELFFPNHAQIGTGAQHSKEGAQLGSGA
jgi:hypothetical protein